AGSLEGEGRRLREWLARGYHGEMSWMARDVEKRINPREIFPQARSVVVVALNYYTPHQHQQNPATGKVSRYAWGDDYHDVVKTKLASLLSWIREPRERFVSIFNRRWTRPGPCALVWVGLANTRT